MKTLKFRYAGAWNFLPFGPEGIELYFDDYGQVVLVTGENLDTGTDRNPASNGTGKSSLQDILSYAIYGQTVKRPKKLNHDTLINSTSKKGLLVDVQFDDYRIVRGREPNKLDVWYSKDHIWDKNSKVTKGSLRETQEFIEGVVGLSHAAFCNVVVFDDSNAYSFLELDAAGKRQLVESLLGLDRYRAYHESAKSVVKEHKQKIRDLSRDVEALQLASKEAESRISKIKSQHDTWVQARRAELVSLEQKLADKQTQLASTTTGNVLSQYDASQQKAVDLLASIESLGEKHRKITEALSQGRTMLSEARGALSSLEDQLQTHKLDYRRFLGEVQTAQRTIAGLTGLQEGTTCPTCHGKVARENYETLLKHQSNVLTASEASASKEEVLIADLQQKIAKKTEYIERLRKNIADAESKETAVTQRIAQETKERKELLDLPKPELSSVEQVLEAAIVVIKKQISDKQAEIEGVSPYKEILEHAEDERVAKLQASHDKSKELEEAEALLPYREWWVDAFGDKGIRKHLVEKIIPALNSRVAYWLQYLIDSKIQLTFDSEFNETITRNGVEAYYHAMSNGEKRRINLAVSRSFAYVMILNSGHCPSLVFLDEVTGGGIDSAGVTGIYNMITELAKEQQVFVTTHNQALLHLLDGCESLKLVKKDDVTTLAK